jgi:hypothetical protein
LKFEDYINSGIVRKQSPDLPRARFLIKEASKSFDILYEMEKKLGISDDNANIFIRVCHDVLMELLRAKMLIDGYKAHGQGAHEAEVAYGAILGLNTRDIRMLDELRYLRNQILYNGEILDKDYAVNILGLTKKLYPLLRNPIIT